jgi:hypothetical protein
VANDPVNWTNVVGLALTAIIALAAALSVWWTKATADATKSIRDDETRPLLVVTGAASCPFDNLPSQAGYSVTYPLTIQLTNVGKGPAIMLALDVEDITGGIKQAHLGAPISFAAGSTSYVKLWLVRPLTSLKDMNEVKLEVHYWDPADKGFTSAAHLHLGWWKVGAGGHRAEWFVDTERFSSMPPSLGRPAKVRHWQPNGRFRSPPTI